MPDDFSLLTDLYQVTMAQGYWCNGLQDRQACFHLFFRKAPFGASFAIAAGLDSAIEWIEQFQIGPGCVEYLGSLMGNDGKPLFQTEFLQYLSRLRCTLDIDAVPEGIPLMAHEPMLRVQGPLLACQWVESVLLTIVNFQTLIATKAARVCQAAGESSVLEFGLRRAQGIDGALAASRACYIGGCHATSNVLAGKRYGIPVRGTHAHSWVMAFDSELESFQAYARAMPNNCIFLVDTYNTMDGIRNAIRVALQLKENGHRLVGIRLDSGDMTSLSIEARKMLQEAHLPDAVIVASNDLDELEIERMQRHGAQVDVFGVGTKMITAYDQPALGGVYKLGAIRDSNGDWADKIKLSEQWIKVSTPGILNIRRYRSSKSPSIDVVFSESIGAPDKPEGRDIGTGQQTLGLDRFDSYEDLLQPVMRSGERCRAPESLDTIRQRSMVWRAEMPDKVKALTNPARYPVALETRLSDRKWTMLKAHR